MKNKKQSTVSGFSHTLIIAIAGFLLVSGSLGYVFYRNVTKGDGQSVKNTKLEDKTSPMKNPTEPQKEAIEIAKSYKPTGNCLDVLTPAIHAATGAKYTFPSSCIAPGWIADDVNSTPPPAKSLEQLQREAIEAAKAYRSDKTCTADMKPATHTATGAKYTFGGCIAPGWVADPVKSTPPPTNSPTPSPAKSIEQLQREAIEAAKAYRSDKTCTADMKPATHTATGAKYTFGGCIAPGWVADPVKSTPPPPPPPAKSLEQLQREAIEAAKAYRSGYTCFSQMTPAIHSATGARYTFSSSCIAPGWVEL